MILGQFPEGSEPTTLQPLSSISMKVLPFPEALNCCLLYPLREPGSPSDSSSPSVEEEAW